MERFTTSQTVGEIVTLFPKAADLFKANRIDFCCGGNVSVKEAAEKRNLSADELIAAIQEIYDKHAGSGNEKNWNEASYTEIVNHIQETYHAFLREELPNLSPYVTKVMRVHGENHPHLVEVHEMFNRLKAELLEHTEKEDAEQFPAIRAYDLNPTAENLATATKELTDLETEHASVGDILHRLREITNDYTLPEGACRTFQLVYRRLENFENDTFQHIHLENNILFKRLLEEAV
ncbi:iron-sulfur cluster repair di-iron protein [Weizmannia acidilactici]|nr:iron-sulfur cluster repair di-iron protein [Weizmannia acidilactici]GER66708.1 iron-sulfur cluster repair di-iron protein [Weizmannia acidilactici]GER72862.1 iron-sulfur cluster repair di-iron protein [Weizmannia acidilactici]